MPYLSNTVARILDTDMTFMNGLTLAEIVWLNGHEDDPAMAPVADAFNAFDGSPSDENRSLLQRSVEAWRTSSAYPFGGYLKP